MNAFERLIDRTLFAGLGGEAAGAGPDTTSDPQEASKSWALLQALLRQNSQARNYAQRLLLRKATERPGPARGAMFGERLGALLELWPPGEREALSDALMGGGAAKHGNLAVGEGATAVGWSPSAGSRAGAGSSSMSPAVRRQATSSHFATPGFSTPPRREAHSGTPEWGGPLLSESPAPPREQYARRRAETLAPHSLSAACGGVADSAVTVPIRGSHTNQVAVGDSSATVVQGQAARGTSNSLDAWIGPVGTAPGTDASQFRRSQSLPAAMLGAAAGMPGAEGRAPWSPQPTPSLVLDFGPSGSSEDDRAHSARHVHTSQASLQHRLQHQHPSQQIGHHHQRGAVGQQAQVKMPEGRNIKDLSTVGRASEGGSLLSSGSSGGNERTGRRRVVSLPRHRQSPPGVQQPVSDTEEEESEQIGGGHTFVDVDIGKAVGGLRKKHSRTPSARRFMAHGKEHPEDSGALDEKTASIKDSKAKAVAAAAAEAEEQAAAAVAAAQEQQAAANAKVAAELAAAEEARLAAETALATETQVAAEAKAVAEARAAEVAAAVEGKAAAEAKAVAASKMASQAEARAAEKAFAAEAEAAARIAEANAITQAVLAQASKLRWTVLAGAVQKQEAAWHVAQLRAAVASWRAASWASSKWQSLAAREQKKQVMRLPALAASIASEFLRSRCLTDKLRSLAVSLQGQRVRHGLATLTRVGRSRRLLLALARVPRLQGLRVGWQGWQQSCRTLQDYAWQENAMVGRFQELGHRAWAVQRTRELHSWLASLQVWAGHRHAERALRKRSRRVVGAAGLFTSLHRHMQRNLTTGFLSLRGLPEVCEARQSLGARSLFAALEHCVRRRKGRTLNWMRGVYVEGLRSAEFDRQSQAHLLSERRILRQSQADLQSERRILRHAMSVWQMVRLRPRRLAAPLMQAAHRVEQWALRRLMMHTLELRCEQRLGRVVATKAHAIHADSQLALEDAKRHFEDQLQGARLEQEHVLQRLASVRARETERLCRIADRELLAGAWAQWQLRRRQARATMSLGQLMIAREQRKHLQVWRRRAEVAALSYLEVQIDCFDSYTAKRTDLSWRVLHRCGSYWAAELEDESIISILRGWCEFVADAKLRRYRQRLACEKLAITGTKLIRSRAWSPWEQWQVSEQRSLVAAMRQVEESHAIAQIEQLKEELQMARIQAGDQRETVAAEFSMLQVERQDLEACSRNTMALLVQRTWHNWADQQRRRSLRQVLSSFLELRKAHAHFSARAAEWQRMTSALVAIHPLRVRAAQTEVAMYHAERQSAMVAEAARLRRPRARLAAFAAALRLMQARKWGRQVARSLRQVAAVRTRIGGLVGILKRASCRMGLQEWRQFADSRRAAEWQWERRQAELLSWRSEGARALGSLLVSLRNKPLRWAFGRFEEAVRYNAVPRPAAVARLLRALRRPCQRLLSEAAVHWQRASTAGAWRAAAMRGRALGEFRAEEIVQRLARKSFVLWHARSCAPRRIRLALDGPVQQCLGWAMRQLQAKAARRGQAVLRSLCFGAACRRHRLRELSALFHSWRVDFAQAERRQRVKMRSNTLRAHLRVCRNAFRAWTQLSCWHKAIWRMGSVLQRSFGVAGLRAWRNQAARLGGSVVAEEAVQMSMRKALQRQKTECEKLMESRSREGAARTAKVLLHAWRCSQAAESSFQAQRMTAARALVRRVAGVQRSGQRAALERWRACAMAGGAEMAVQRTVAASAQQQKLQRVWQGLMMLESVARHRQRLALSQALSGSWRTARWQALVRTLDASASREQRRLRADCDSLRVQLVSSEEQAMRFSALEVGEAERNDQTREEAQAILVAVQKERAKKADEIQRWEAMEAEARDDSMELRDELNEALSKAMLLEAEQNQLVQELSAARTALKDAQSTSEEHVQAELKRERIFHEQAQALQQKALASGYEMRDAEREIRERAERAEREVADRARKSEQVLEQMLQEKGHACDLQASMADEQDRNIRNLESLLKEQREQLQRERESRTKDLDTLRASASFSESKSCLLQEQVTALRQQLQREHSELNDMRASERAWYSDRAALLSAVASKGHHRTRSSNAAVRRKASPAPAITAHGQRDSHGNCPWHGRGAGGKAAPALM